MAVGTSSSANVYLAGQEAAQLMAQQLGAIPHLTLVFASLRFADARLLNGIMSVTEGAPLAGCTDAGGINTSGPVRRSVTVVGFKIDHGFASVGAGMGISVDPEAAGEELGKALKSAGTPRLVLMFPDGISGSAEEIVAGLQKRLSPGVPLAGAASGDDFLFQRCFQFCNGKILSDAVVGAALAGEFSAGIGIRHGWEPVGRPFRVTKALGRTVMELDGRPAIFIYEDYLGIRYEDMDKSEPFPHLASTYPLGIYLQGFPEHILRQAIKVGTDGSLLCSAGIPEGSEVYLMFASRESALQAADRAARDVAEMAGRDRLKGALVFCSVGRQKMLGSEFQGEIDVIRNALGGSGIRLGGFYGYGEHAPVRVKQNGQEIIKNIYHNESVVVVGLGG